jgi:hypothetical protein
MKTDLSPLLGDSWTRIKIENRTKEAMIDSETECRKKKIKLARFSFNTSTKLLKIGFQIDHQIPKMELVKLPPTVKPIISLDFLNLFGAVEFSS